MQKTTVTTGVYIISSSDQKFKILCGCPVDVVKLLIKRGLIQKIEKDGYVYENGPHAILLSDLSMQNGQLCNMVEFPILHMQFLQGMQVPDHPNNRGQKPILVGLEEQIVSQCRYFSAGKYGLGSLQELLDSGLDQETSHSIMHFKQRFNYGQMPKISDTLDLRILNGYEKLQITPTLSIQRTAFNVYQFQEHGETINVDLNLAANEYYESPYTLSHYQPPKDYFSVVHLGEGNGWDPDRANMSSLICHQGRYYLVDAPAGVEELLQCNGISVNELEGIFHTHSHDDHFAGLTALIRAEHPIKYYATGAVRHAVIKKFTSLLNCDVQTFHSIFSCFNLEFDKWNDVNGLEVLPCLSPHPVETSIFYFRSLWNNGYRTYGHLADIVSLRVLHEFSQPLAEQKETLSAHFVKKVKQSYFFQADLKKVDVGGGLIHGEADDFRNDLSSRLILSHTEKEPKNRDLEIGNGASFGLVDVLIPARHNMMIKQTEKQLRRLFPKAKISEINLLLNQPLQQLKVGQTILRKGEEAKTIILLLSGTVERINTERNHCSQLAVGSLIGAMPLILNRNSEYTYYSTSYINVLNIPYEIYLYLVNKYSLKKQLAQIYEQANFLQHSSVFESSITDSTLIKLSQQLEILHFKSGSFIQPKNKAGLYLLRSGAVAHFKEGEMSDLYLSGTSFGEESIIDVQKFDLSYEVLQDAQVLFFDAKILRPIPSIFWQLREHLVNKIARMN